MRYIRWKESGKKVETYGISTYEFIQTGFVVQPCDVYQTAYGGKC